MISTNVLLLGSTNTIIQQSYAQRNNNTINNANDILAYQNPKYGMKMQYPLPWQNIELNRVMGWEQPVVPVRPYLSVVAITSMPKDGATPVVAGNATATNASSTTIPSTINITNKAAVTSFQAARHQYLEAWNHTTFHSAFDAFIQQGSDKGYGVYITHPPVFKPGDSIALYVEPVGYSFKQVIDEQGNSLNQVNLTADITLTTKCDSSYYYFS